MNESLRYNSALLLREIRQQQGISQEKLAKKSGIDRTFISGVERNQRNITLDTLEKLLDALEIDKKHFLLRLAEMKF
ncbi:helix-turn-helix domain-containing protein [Photobacterium indicum]|uniref:helix-turn-helix domain-containing protein n=1 Tax=Photobacterium indicum TaxID=81447 RepID=UPI003D14D240